MTTKSNRKGNCNRRSLRDDNKKGEGKGTGTGSDSDTGNGNGGI